tara:strand:- start:1399 stop:1725 length:327 start_codon:yes stop_codon:yes gene_type:complete
MEKLLPTDIVDYIYEILYRGMYAEVMADFKKNIKHTLSLVEFDGNMQSKLDLQHLQKCIWYRYFNNYLQVILTKTIYRNNRTNNEKEKQGKNYDAVSIRLYESLNRIV